MEFGCSGVGNHETLRPKSVAMPAITFRQITNKQVTTLPMWVEIGLNDRPGYFFGRQGAESGLRHSSMANPSYSITYWLTATAWSSPKHSASKLARARLVQKPKRRGCSHFPEVIEIGKKVKRRGLDTEESIDLMEAMIARWCEDHYGPVIAAVLPTLKGLFAEFGG